MQSRAKIVSQRGLGRVYIRQAVTPRLRLVERRRTLNDRGGIASGEARDIAMQGARGVLGADVHED